MKSILLFVIYCFLSLLTFSQERQFEKIDPLSMNNDIDSLVNTILKTHQNPYTYCTDQEFNAAIVVAKDKSTDSLNTYEFAGVVAHLLSTIRDSHTYLNYSSLIHKYQTEGGRTMDFNLVKIKDEYIITKDKNNMIPVGCRLDSINGIAVEQLFNKVNTYSIFEGNSINANTRITEAIFANSIGYVTPLSDYNNLVIQDSSETKHLRYPANQKIINKKRKKKSKTSPILIKNDSTLDNELAVIKISSFSEKGTRNFNRFLKRSFKTIKKKNIEFVAIDLRNNLGGQINRTDVLMSYLTENSPYIPSNIIAKQSELSKKMYRSKINGFMFFFLKIYPFKNEVIDNFITQVKMAEGEVDTLYYKSANPYYSKKYNFGGKSFLMINGMSGSASVLFSSAYRNEIKDGVIVGEPCLGPKTGTWGNPANYMLPNSKLQIFISTIRTNIDDSFLTDSLEFNPDYYVPKTLSSIINSTDDQLNFINEFIINQKK